MEDQSVLNTNAIAERSSAGHQGSQPSVSYNFHVSNSSINNSILGGNNTKPTIAEGPSKHPIDAQNKNQRAALEKLSTLQQKHREPDVMFLGLETSQDIPVVHPKLIEASVLKRHNKGNEPYNPSTKHCKDIEYKEELSFESLINRSQKSSFMTLIGQAGSGKTTISKRLVKEIGSCCFLLKFMEMNNEDNDGGDDLLTLRQLLLDNKYPELSEEECKLIFDWIVEHDDRCVFILEGFDQWQLKFNKNANRHGLKKPQSVKSLLSNLCHKRFLPRSHIILTSRPHSITSIPKSITSNCTILLQDLSFKDMKKLFLAFAGNNAKQVWDELHARAPQLVSACLNPLMLQLIVKACLSSSTDDIGIKTTMTRVFDTILSELRHSNHTHIDDINTILDKLSELAFNATLKHTVVMTLNDLLAVGLNIKTAQDLIMAKFIHRSGCIKVFEGDAKLYFCHQMFQEFFAARYISKLMSYNAFKEFVATKLFTPHWVVVRHFVFGILLDLKLIPDAEKDVSQNLSRNVDGPSTLGLEKTKKEKILRIRRQRCSVATKRPHCSKSSDLDDRVKETANMSTYAGSSQSKSRRLHNTAKEESQPSSSNPHDDRVNEITNLPENEETRERVYQTRVDILTEELMKRMAANPSGHHLINLCHDVREANSDDIAKQAADKFPEEADLDDAINLYSIQSFSSSDAHALSYVIKKIDKKIKKLDMNNCDLPTEKFRFICEAIQEMNGTIDELDIGGNVLSSSSIDDIIAIMSEINVCLRLDDCFYDGGEVFRNPNTEERNKIQSVLNKLPSKLNVVVERDGRDDYIILSKQPIVTQQ